MTEFIDWCNSNTGFLTAVLSILGLFISVWAVVVSIKTAKLPYKKKIKLSFSTDIVLSKNAITGEISREINGISVNVLNIGSRNLNISYLGLSIKNHRIETSSKRLAKIKDEVTGNGVIAPYEIHTELYKKSDLLYCLSQLRKKAKVYLYARDTEGTEYFKKLGYAKDIVKSLSFY